MGTVVSALTEFCEQYPGIVALLTDNAGKVLCSAGDVSLAPFLQELTRVQSLEKLMQENSPDIEPPAGYWAFGQEIKLDANLKGRLIIFGPTDSQKAGLTYPAKLLGDRVAALLETAKLQRDLCRQARYQEAISESVTDGLLLVNKNGCINFMNIAGARILGVNREWATGRHVSEIVDFRPVVLDVIASGKGYTDKEFVLKGKTGKIFHFMKTAVPIRDENGEVSCVVDTFREIRKVQKMVTSMTGFAATFRFEDIVGGSSLMSDCIRLARIAAQSPSNVLIQGESGTGKELFAQAIHNESILKDGPFVAVNCAAIPRELIESELFGYEEGAFTGAAKGGRPGKFELANEGTIFLDEIGDMPLDMQVKLLRVIQEHRVTRIGGSNVFSFNGRIIAATNRDLQREVAEGSFRRDLFYRLNVLMLSVPPLRERREDIIPTACSIVERLCSKLGREKIRIGEEALEALVNYDWPGNVRELENVLERAINISVTEIIVEKDLPKALWRTPKHNLKPLTAANERLLSHVEREAIQTVLAGVDFNISQAAKMLGVTRNTLYSKIAKYGLRPV